MADKGKFDENKFDTFLKAYFNTSGKSDSNSDMFEAGRGLGKLLAGIYAGFIEAGMDDGTALGLVCGVFSTIISGALNTKK